MSKDIINKHKVYMVDNIEVKNAKYLSIKYPNIIFFTNTGEICKNGILYTSILGVDPNYNTLEVNHKTYKLSLQNKMLRLSLAPTWYWYIGTELQTEITNVEPTTSNLTGWRIITNKENVINGSLANNTIDEIWPLKENSVSSISLPNGINPKQDSLYLYLPHNLIVHYNVGLYDVFELTNFLNEGGVLTKLSNITIDDVLYEVYQFNTTPKDTFNLKIYSKQ